MRYMLDCSTSWTEWIDKKMKELHNKMSVRGVRSLEDTELLSLLLEDEDLASALMSEYGSLRSIAQLPLSRLRMSAGLGTKRSERISVAVEIGRRITSAEGDIEQHITSSNDAVEIMRAKIKDLQHEECWAIFLSNSNRILDTYRISQGGIQATVVDQRIIVKRALELLATRLILVHNHPSGSTTPSNADITLTRRVSEATALFDIQLLDHIIISSTGSYYSFKQEGRL